MLFVDTTHLTESMPDAALYRSLARNLLESGTFGREPGVAEDAVPPGYPFFVASVFAVAGRHGLLAVQLVQCLLGALSLLPLFALARQTSPEDERVAVVSSLAAAVHPVLVLWPGFLLTETLYTFVSLVFLSLLVLSLDRFGWLVVLGTGLAFAASLLVREVLIGFALAVVAAAAWRFGLTTRLLRYVSGFALGAVLLLAPWTMRNLASTGRLELLTARATSVLEAGERVTPDARRLRSPEDAARYADYHEMASPGAAIADPTGYLWAVAVRLEFTWLHPNGLQSLPAGPLRWLYRLAHALVLVLALAGLVEALRSRRWRGVLLAAVWIYTAAIHLFVSTAVPRYSIPVLPLILLFATAGALGVWDRSTASR